MRLDHGVIRELHWHKQAEWAYVLEGSCRITALDTEGGSFMDDLQKGDLWYFLQVIHIRSKVSVRMVPSSSWSLMTATLMKSRHFC